MDRILIITLVALLLRGTLATFETRNVDYGPIAELLDDIRSVLQEIPLSLDAGNRITKLETKMEAAEENIRRFHGDRVDVNSSMTKLETKIEEVEKNIRRFHEDVVDMKSGMTKLETEMEAEKENIRRFYGDRVDMNSSMTKLGTKIEAAEENIRRFYDDVVDMKSSMTKMETKMEAAEVNIQQCQGDIVDMNSKMQETSQRGQALKAQFDSAVAQFGKVSEDRQAAGVLLNRKIQTATEKLSANLERLEDRLAKLEINVTKVSGKLDANSVAIAGRATCPEPFQLVKDDCLFVVAEYQKTWADARVNCKNKAAAHGLKGDLAVPSDIPAFLDFMKEHVSTPWPWIGASAVDDQATKWKWVTGATLDQSDFPWDTSEPTKRSSEKTLCLKQKNLKFHNCDGTLKLHSVCEIFL